VNSTSINWKLTAGMTAALLTALVAIFFFAKPSEALELADIDVVPNPVDFADVSVGDTEVVPVEVTNNGDLPVIVASVELLDPDGDFDFTLNPDLPDNIVVAPGATITLGNVTVTPSTGDPIGTILMILTDAGLVEVPVIASNSNPKISGEQPKPGKKVKVRKPAIRAVVSDEETNLDKSDIKLFVDNQEKTNFNYNRETDRLKYRPPRKLSFGTHKVRISATDEQQSTTTETWRFKVQRRR
jgi:hypothetical protein